MRKHMALAGFLISLACILIRETNAQSDPCKAVLERGIFNSTTITSNIQSQKAFEDWQCTTEFSTYEELKKNGIGIGVVVYGVPVSATWSMDNATRSAWKSAHCQHGTSSSDYAARYEQLVRLVSPDVMRAWSECIRTVYGNTLGLKCYITAPDPQTAIFSIKFTPVDEHDTVLPIVKSSSVTGAKPSDTSGLSPGQVMKNEKTIGHSFSIVALERQDPKKPISVTVNTTRGGCNQYVPPPTVVYRTKVTITPEGEMPVAVNENLHLDDGSDNCDINENRIATYTLKGGENITGWGTPGVTSSNCPTGKSYPISSSVRKLNPTTVAIDYHLEGCGRNGPWGIAGCAGRGWLVFDMPVNGVRYQKNSLPAYSSDTGETTVTQTTNTIDYPNAVPQGWRNIVWNYTVEIIRRVVLGDLVIEQRVSKLSNVNPNGDGIQTKIVNGRLGITISPSPPPIDANSLFHTLDHLKVKSDALRITIDKQKEP